MVWGFLVNASCNRTEQARQVFRDRIDFLRPSLDLTHLYICIRRDLVDSYQFHSDLKFSFGEYLIYICLMFVVQPLILCVFCFIIYLFVYLFIYSLSLITLIIEYVFVILVIYLFDI